MLALKRGILRGLVLAPVTIYAEFPAYKDAITCVAIEIVSGGIFRQPAISCKS
jgi:hypothetical protein